MAVVDSEIPATMLEGYRGKFAGEPHRLQVVGEPYETRHPYFNNADPGLRAFLDYFTYETPGHKWADVGFISTEDSFRGQGMARELMEALYARHPDRTIRWGRIMDDSIEHLRDDFRDRFPERTGSTGQGEWALDPDPPDDWWRSGCPECGHELDVAFHGGTSCPKCGWEGEMLQGGQRWSARPGASEEVADDLWPDHLPWGEAEQEYYRTAALTPARKAYERLVSEGGFSVRPGGSPPPPGYYVSLEGHTRVVPMRSVTENDVANYMEEKAQTARGPGLFFGGWASPSGDAYLDVSRAFEGLAEAVEFGRANGQEAIWDGFLGREVRLDDPLLEY
jgi:GNAT superfamily N-acetyltransferase